MNNEANDVGIDVVPENAVPKELTMVDGVAEFLMACPCQVMDTDLGDVYITASNVYVTDQHLAVKSASLQRSGTALIAGQLFTSYVADRSIFTLDELAGEFGGAVPVPKEDPRKPMLLELAANITSIAWAMAQDGTDLLPGICDQHLIRDRATVAPLLPATKNGEPLAAVAMLYKAMGGHFHTLAGMAFLYGQEGSPIEPDNRYVMLLPELEMIAHPDRPEGLQFLQGILNHRNKLAQEQSEANLVFMYEQLVAYVPGDWTKPAAEPTPEVDPAAAQDEVVPEPVVETAVAAGEDVPGLPATDTTEAPTDVVTITQEDIDHEHPADPIPRAERLGLLSHKWGHTDPLQTHEKIEQLLAESRYGWKHGKPVIEREEFIDALLTKYEIPTTR